MAFALTVAVFIAAADGKLAVIGPVIDIATREGGNCTVGNEGNGNGKPTLPLPPNSGGVNKLFVVVLFMELEIVVLSDEFSPIALPFTSLLLTPTRLSLPVPPASLLFSHILPLMLVGADVLFGEMLQFRVIFKFSLISSSEISVPNDPTPFAETAPTAAGTAAAAAAAAAAFANT